MKSAVTIPDNLSAGDLRHWFAAYTSSCQEKRVAQHLSTRSIEFFLPVHREIKLWKNGVRATIEKPLFPGYVFVKIESKARVRVLELPGVHSIVGTGRQPIPLPFGEIEALRIGMHLVKAQPHPLLRSGEKVIIRKGPLEGLKGIVLRQRNSTRVIITLDLIMNFGRGCQSGSRTPWSRSATLHILSASNVNRQACYALGKEPLKIHFARFELLAFPQPRYFQS